MDEHYQNNHHPRHHQQQQHVNPNANENSNENRTHRNLNGFRLYDDYVHDYRENDSDNDSPSSDDDGDDVDGAAYGNSSDNGSETAEVWVFGYGSLCWNPGFQFTKCVTGYVRGFVRRFWQGNTTHRGTKDKPGRVVTLVQQSDGITWGCAYKITGSTALCYLKQRECTLGGYETLYTKFYPRIAADDMAFCGEAFPTLLYIATEANDLWMGDTPLPIIAQEIADCRGASGTNVEYLLRLANFMRDELDGVSVEDDHLFELETMVRRILDERNVSVHSLMGCQPERIRRDSHEEIRRPLTFEFSSRVPTQRLRCLNI